MSISREDALRQVIEALKEISEQVDVMIDINTNPIETLALDSGQGVYFACEIEARLPVKIPDEVNPFVVDKPKPRARTVGEIAELLVTLSENEEEAS